MGSQTGLHVTYRYLLIEGSQSPGSRGRCVAMHQYDVGLRLDENITHACEHTGGDIIEILPLLHDVEVVVRLDIKDFEHLVKHLAVLSRNADYCFKLLGMFLELLDKRCHFYRFGTCAEDKHYFLHYLKLTELNLSIAELFFQGGKI